MDTTEMVLLWTLLGEGLYQGLGIVLFCRRNDESFLASMIVWSCFGWLHPGWARSLIRG